MLGVSFRGVRSGAVRFCADAPFVGVSASYMARLLCDWRIDVALEGEVRLWIRQEEHAEERMAWWCQISVKLAGQRLDTTWPPRLYSARWRLPFVTLGVL